MISWVSDIVRILLFSIKALEAISGFRLSAVLILQFLLFIFAARVPRADRSQNKDSTELTRLEDKNNGATECHFSGMVRNRQSAPQTAIGRVSCGK
jgi:hypothetical protein